MILILSIDEDHSTKDVLEWLVHYDQPFFIIHPEDSVIFKYAKDCYTLEINNTIILLSEITSYWYRRGVINLEFANSKVTRINQILLEEKVILTDFIYHLLESKNHINKRIDNAINKLKILKIAQRNNLLVPFSYFNMRAKNRLQPLITKPISGTNSIKKGTKTFVSYTSEVDSQSPDQFFLNRYFQDNIQKKYELRIFYLHGKFWSMAIFSQRDSQTQVDFRRYNTERPNRTVPYQLPKDIEVKLTNLMNEININSGSIDIIVTPKDEFYFLEVNPIGQFGMTSFPCNYHIESEIAKFLAYE